MQVKKQRISNIERSKAMRLVLLVAGRQLFVAQGYADTTTPQIVKAASVTRGALYHHFNDKLALFRAVVEQEAESVAAAIKQSGADGEASLEMMIAGSGAYFDAMREPGRSRLLLIDGPAVLGVAKMKEIMAARDGAQLEEGLKEALKTEGDFPLEALADILSAAFDRAALAVSVGADEEPYHRAINLLLTALVREGHK